jgi:manganese/zinc/iron transport system permease protein
MNMTLSADEIWVVATAAACAVACTIPGIFLMLQRSSLLGDAISHAILPGLAVGFMLSGSRHPMIMMLSALVAGLLTAICSTALRSLRVIKDDAALGIVFTSFFALGVILISWTARSVDLDPGCVLYGVIEFSSFDTIEILSLDIPRSFVMLSLIALLNGALMALFFKELTLSTFDHQLASMLGFSPHLLRYGLMCVVTVTAVAAFEAVGSILVVSMLITPAATAFLLVNRLRSLAILAILIALTSAVAGYAGALALNTSVAGMMSVMAAVAFVAALLLSPSQGIIRGFLSSARLRYRICCDDILGLLYRWHEAARHTRHTPLARVDILSALGSSSFVKLALWTLHRTGEVVTTAQGALHLSERGLVEAAAVVRSHRLWEAYLAKHLGLPHDHLHESSERTEHFIGRALARELQDELSTTEDPHGKSIP